MSCPPGMDPSYLFRSPLLSDAENNNLMAAAAAAEKTRALMMMGAIRPPTGPPVMPPPPLFPNPALAALTSGAAASSVAASAAAAAALTTTTVVTPSPPHLNTISQNRDNLSLISHWSAIHQAALANSIQMASEANKRSSPPTPTPPIITPSTTSDLRLARPLFPNIMPPMRFSPYIIPTAKRMSPSPPNSTEDSRSSPLDRIRAESTSPTA